MVIKRILGLVLGYISTLGLLLGQPIQTNPANPHYYLDNPIADSRVEAWEFIVGGGSGFNHLNGLYTPANLTGKSPENEQILGALRNLKQFIESFDFLKMQPDRNFVVNGLSAPHVYYRALSESRKQYALYVHHSTLEHRGWYTVVAGTYREDLIVVLPAGDYKVEWINPASGATVANENFRHDGGNRALSTPTYNVDIALRITMRWPYKDTFQYSTEEGTVIQCACV